MKHKSEDISRLDGDLYETLDGQLIDVSKIASIGNPIAYDKGWWPGYRLTFNEGGSLKISLELVLNGPVNAFLMAADHESGPEAGIKRISEIGRMVDPYRQQFIEVWKHWKRENK